MPGLSAARQGAVFLDRDGVLNANIQGGYVTGWAAFRWLPGAIDAIAMLNRLGWKAFIVTNQACIGKGLASRSAIDSIHEQMRQELESRQAFVDGIYLCPHRPESGCACRKPKPGLLFQAAEEHGIELPASYFVGDALSDMLAARAAGVSRILVRSGRGRMQEAETRRLHAAERYCEGVMDAVDYIAQASHESKRRPLN